jgi:hypothetical protein
MSAHWVDLLKNLGDPIDQEGAIQYKLGETFPRYAEFWGKYVLPNETPLTQESCVKVFR